MVVVPTPAALALPLLPAALEMVATDVVRGRPGGGLGEVEGAPVGVVAGGGELLGRPLGDRGIGRGDGDGVQRDAVTVRTVDPLTVPIVALMVEVPGGDGRGHPFDPAALEMVATAVSDDAQVTWVVRFWVVPSVKVPVAVKGTAIPTGMLGLAGVTAIDWSVAAVTVSVVLPVFPESAAVMALVPTPTVLARPFDPAALEMVATAVVAEAQVTWLVRSWVELSEKVPVAVNCPVCPWR